jgi:hypothetical protein
LSQTLPATVDETPAKKASRRRKSLEQRVKVRGADSLNAFTKAISRGDCVDLARALMSIAFDEKVFPADRIRAIQTILNYKIGRPKQLLEVKQTSKTDVRVTEQRVAMLLGIEQLEDTVKPVDSTVRVSTEEDRHQRVEGAGGRSFALPAPLPAGQKPIPDLGEVEASGGDVVQRAQERAETHHEGKAA